MGRKPKDTKHLFLRGGRWWIKFNRGDTHIIKTTGCVEADLKAPKINGMSNCAPTCWKTRWRRRPRRSRT